MRGPQDALSGPLGPARVLTPHRGCRSVDSVSTIAGMTNPTLTIPARDADGEIVTDHTLAGIARCRAQWATRNAFADELADATPEAAYLALVADFTAEHQAHRQYDGWVNGAVLVKATTRIAGKGGVKAEAGDYLLGHYTPGLGYSAGSWTCYTARVGWNLGGPLPVRVAQFACPECGTPIGFDGDYVPGHHAGIAHDPECTKAAK